ncbi:MAG: protein translocase subunit SecF, partial [Proteobacteria bacterium]|nr:protein translocase subunit SecF [Pseudomonadota bacterium]
MMNIPFTKFTRTALIFSAAMLAIAISALFIRGLNLGLDFTGGVSVELKYESKADLEKIRGSLNKIDGANFVVLNFGSDEDVLIKFQSDESLNLNAETV